MPDNQKSLIERVEARKKNKRPKIFLVLASAMLGVTVLAYVFEEQLYDISHSSETFVFLISLSLILALFFLSCYRIPRLGLKLLGRDVELGDAGSKEIGVTYNVFKGESAVEEKLHASKRKKTRHERRSFKNQKVQVNAPIDGEKDQ